MAHDHPHDDLTETPPASREAEPVVGIDLGTTNSLVAYVKDGAPFVIRDKSGDGLVPSIVSAPTDGTIYVGREAQRRLLTDPRKQRIFNLTMGAALVLLAASFLR